MRGMLNSHRLVQVVATAAVCVGVGAHVLGQTGDRSAGSTGPSASAAPVAAAPTAPVGPMAAHAEDANAGATDAALSATYCVTCHNARLKTGGLAMDDLDLTQIGAQAEVGEKIVRKLRAGLMPPAGLPRPSVEALDAWAGRLEARLDAAAAAAPRPLTPGLHRLNRREYANAVRALVGLEIDPATLLPVDDSSYGFDNMAGTLGTSPALIEAYVSAAAKIARLALGHELGATEKTYLAPPDYSQTHRAEGLAFGTRGGLQMTHLFPADGDYVFNWTPVRSNAGGLFGVATGEQLELTLDGTRVALIDVEKEVGRGLADRNEVRIPVTAGPHAVGLAFVARTHVPSEDFNQHFERTTLTQNIPGFTFDVHVNSLSIAGPFAGARPASTPSRDRILVCRPAAATEEVACARTILGTLARTAYRRPVTDGDVDTLMRFFTAGSEDGTFEDGIERALQMLLADPEFLYRVEQGETGVAAGAAVPVTELELASRLSFFLWSSGPDDELIRLASAGGLRRPGVLEAQVTRMLADPRASELVRNFAGQWLLLRNLQASAPIGDLYPDFDDNLRQAFRTETELFVESIVREDRNVVRLLDADYTFVNDRLARHYGIPGVYGSQFRRVALGPAFAARRGLLGQGSILTVSSIADRTSPVKRGKWVLTNVLGVQPPDPPPNVPVLEMPADTAAQKKTPSMRARMEAHRQPACASCHRMIDPLGFALEEFDAIGRARTTENGEALDLSGALVDGTPFVGAAQLREALVAGYAPRFVQGLTENLLTYALGRGVEYSDMPVVRQIVRQAATQDYRFSALVQGIVTSAPFQQTVRPAAATTTAAR